MNTGLKRWGLRGALALCLSALSAHFGAAQTLTWISHWSASESYASGVSADGCVVSGTVRGWGGYGAFFWTPRWGTVLLFPYTMSHATSVSADGQVIVGYRYNELGMMAAFRWTEEEVAEIGNQFWAYDVSDDGNVLVGEQRESSGRPRAYRWRPSSAVEYLGTLGGSYSVAAAASGDGSVCVGTSRTMRGHFRAFRWQNEVMEELGTLGGWESYAQDVSADGSVVVGFSTLSNGQNRAFRWTRAVGMINLGILEGDESRAHCVSADGRVIGGWARNSAGVSRAFRWTEARGMENLNQVYAHLLSPGSFLEVVNAISSDGRYLVGTGYNYFMQRYEAYLLDTWRMGDTNGDGCVDDTDLLAVLSAFGTRGTGLTRHEDINKDDVVDDADLLTVLFAFGQSGSGLPEDVNGDGVVDLSLIHI
ncbi:MAG: hypothetical protein N2651_00625, partial [Fimbriimonadales bacterium]|nr:hypothetical protein [Fimbriimonadales bacterium]